MDGILQIVRPGETQTHALHLPRKDILSSKGSESTQVGLGLAVIFLLLSVFPSLSLPSVLLSVPPVAVSSLT